MGKYFNGWAAHAFDPSFGPKHPISEKLARVSCALLDASKTGFDAATMHLDKYLRKPLPYHLLAKDKRETAESSLSSLDRLTLLIKQAETSLTISENLGHHELDEDYQLVAGESDPLYPLRSKYLLKWKDRCDEYFESKKEIVISKENKQNSNKYDELRIKYRNLFDIDRAVIFAELLKLRRIEYNPAERKSVFIYNIEREASHFLAAIVYEVTYLKYFSRLTFCWEVCGRELHSLKDSVNKRKRDEAIMSAPGDRDDSVYCPLAPSIESLLV